MKNHKLLSIRENLSFGFEQTFTIPEWWTEPGFTSTSDTPLKREKMLDFAKELSIELNGSYFESKDIWDHMQYEVCDKSGETQFFITIDPGSIEVKTPPCLVKDTQTMAAPLFIAAQRAGVVPYRNWWYGVQAGTEGGCHVNMGGFTDETNPLKQDPTLVVKYAAYVHNRPWLHHPFMGVDVGPQGNAMRMDEKPDFEVVKNRFRDYIEIQKNNKSLTAQETYDFFKDTNLITEKGSFPSLYKFKTGLFLIEDRAQEALRNAEDFQLVSELRVQILEELSTQKLTEQLSDFPNLHTSDLTSFHLWREFSKWTNGFKLETQKYLRFFERQFPKLTGGTNQPEKICIKDGRRPRVITQVHKRGDVVTCKTIDTSFKRFEIYTCEETDQIKVEGKGIEFTSELKTDQLLDKQYYHLYIDVKFDNNEPVLHIQAFSKSQLIESCRFNMKDMMWCE